MSGFLSDKYLRYRGVAHAATIDEDTPCPQCGYNLRGLPAGRVCPECGGETFDAVSSARRGPLIDALLHGDDASRSRWKIGLTLAIGVIIAPIVARAVMFGIGFRGFTSEILTAYVALGAALSLLWIIAVFMIMPPVLAEHWPWMRTWRRVVLITQCFWLVGYAAWFMKLNAGGGNAADLWQAMQFGSRAVAACGFIVLGFLLTYIAEEAELEPGWQRLNTATWLLPIPTLIGLLFGASMPWILLIGLGFVLIWWGWLLGLFVLGLWQMRQHVAWGMRHHVNLSERMERIAEKRAEMDARVAAQVRPTPGTPVHTPTHQHAATAATSDRRPAKSAAPPAEDDPIPLADDDRAELSRDQIAGQPPPRRSPGTSLWDV